MAVDFLHLAGATDSEAFKEDFSFLISDDGLKVGKLCLQSLPDFYRIEGDAGRQSFVRLFAKEHSVSPDLALRAFRLLRFIAQGVIQGDLSSEMKAEDRNQVIAYAGEPAATRFLGLVKDVESLRGLLNQALVYRREVGGVLPMLQNCMATVDARVIWDAKHESIIDLVPIASFAFRLDSGSPDILIFQASELAVEEMMNSLTEIKETMIKTRIILKNASNS